MRYLLLNKYYEVVEERRQLPAAKRRAKELSNELEQPITIVIVKEVVEYIYKITMFVFRG
jgi:hypothetical protein